MPVTAFVVSGSCAVFAAHASRIAVPVAQVAAVVAAPAEEPADGTDGDPDGELVSDAERMYRIGEAHFAAADYAAAIETWTAVLTHLPQTEAVHAIRLDLLYNIASAHEAEYDVDTNVRHLRQAVVLFQRYVEERGDADATQDAQRRLDALRERIAEIEASSASTPSEPTTVPATAPSDETPRPASRRDRNLGIGLVAGGGAGVVGGVVLIALGARLRPAALDQVNAMTLDDPDVVAQADAFVDDETRKGRIVMGVGGAVAAVGLAAAGAGTYYLVRYQRGAKATASRRVRWDAGLSPTGGGASVRVTGRF